jgi:predicted nucleotide-binding protein
MPSEELKAFRQNLAEIRPNWSNWRSVETWIAGFRPFLRRYFLQDLPDFDRIATTPQWLCLPGVGGPAGEQLSRQAAEQETATNNQLTEDVQRNLLAFLDTLLRLTVETAKPTERPTEVIPYMPFRPYKRFVAQSFGIAEYHDHIQKAALESGAEEEELQRSGGREAVVASIRRHLPTFDPSEAQSPYDPAWVRLKPILVRAGLNPVDEKVTLTDIKAFLDSTAPAQVKGETNMPNTRNVFVIHGRNRPARDAMFDFLRAVGLNPLEWGQAVKMTGKGSPYIGEVLDAAFSNAQAVVVILTGDDFARLRDEFVEENDPDYEKNLTQQARPNVLFESGMAFGRHSDRTIMVQIGSLRPFSDVAGKHAVHFKGTAEQRTELRERLRTAGCAVTEGGTDWLSAGNFDEAYRLATPAPTGKRKA